VRLKEDHPDVVKVYRHGLTAEVFHLKVEGHHWCLKRCRPRLLVANVDGKTAFLTELERRREIEACGSCTPPSSPTWSAPVSAPPARCWSPPGCGACRCMN
jgi:phage FluMu gp28-like protein